MCSFRLFSNSISYNFKRTISALYITGDKASQNFAVLTPYIDFENRIVDKNELLQNITARNISIDLDNIEKKWRFFKLLDERRKNCKKLKLTLAFQSRIL